MRSMTGFATQSINLSLDGTYSIEATISIKSLNSRFFEAQCRLSHPLTNLETELIKQLKSKLIRGYVQCTILVPDSSAFKEAIEPALHTIQSYLNAVNTIKHTTQIPGTLEIKDLIHLPNVFASHDQPISSEHVQRILHAVNSVVDLLIVEQEREGDLIAQDLQIRITLVQKEIIAIEKETSALMERKKEEVNTELQLLKADENKLMEIGKSAVYLILDKIDIHEEITRFNNHLEYFITLLQHQDIEVGKRLDFTLQELTREINTITAKCSDAAIGRRAINIKVELEKAREQVQNIL